MPKYVVEKQFYFELKLECVLKCQETSDFRYARIFIEFFHHFAAKMGDNYKFEAENNDLINYIKKL